MMGSGAETAHERVTSEDHHVDYQHLVGQQHQVGYQDEVGHQDLVPHQDVTDHELGPSHEHVTNECEHATASMLTLTEPLKLQLASLPQHIASLSSALQQSNHNLEICHDTLLQSLTSESKLRKENEVIKKMRKKDNSYWRSRYVILKQERQAKEDDYEARIVLLKRTAEELERQGEYLEKNGENLEKKREELERQQEGLEKQLGDSQEARARDLAQLSHIRDEKMSLERKLAKYKDLFEKTKEWHASEMNHMKTVHSMASHAGSSAKAIREMQANLRSRVAEMQMEFTREVEGIAAQVRLRDLQHNTKEDALRKLVVDTEAKFLQEQHIRKALHNALIELRGNIRVFCRIRPYLDQQDSAWTTTLPDSPLLPLTVEDPERVSINLPDKSRTFDFDKVFDADATQGTVFSQASPLVTSLLDGFNVAIMAYGQTGSGKTYTMQGTPQEPGIIPQALELLFNNMHHSADRIRYKTEFSMVEIYNEAIYDLLDENDLDKDNKHDLHQTASGTTEVTGLSNVHVQSLDEVNSLIAKGHRLRAVAETRLNATSSRSHCVVMLTVEVHHIIRTPQTPAPTRSKLYLVDLAGSENVGLSGATGDNLREASYINRSLSSLGDVLAALAEGRGHIPYRNSRLTHMLQDALGGSAKMLLVVTASPGQYCQRETMHTLAFGVRASQVARGPAKRRTISTASSSSTQHHAVTTTPSHRLVSSASTPNLSFSQHTSKYDPRPPSPLAKSTTTTAIPASITTSSTFAVPQHHHHHHQHQDKKMSVQSISNNNNSSNNKRPKPKSSTTTSQQPSGRSGGSGSGSGSSPKFGSVVPVTMKFRG